MPYNFKYWGYLYQDKKPIGREAKFCLKGERYVDPVKQGMNKKGCYFLPDQKRIGELQTVFPQDRLGRPIFFNMDRCIILMANQEPLLFWKPLYMKAKSIVLQCLNPGYEEYRCLKKPEDLMVISDQLRENNIRANEKYELKGRKSGRVDYGMVEENS